MSKRRVRISNFIAMYKRKSCDVRTHALFEGNDPVVDFISTTMCHFRCGADRVVSGVGDGAPVRY